MSSGSYYPPPVRRVDIPKETAGLGHSGFRRLPTALLRRWSSGSWSRSWSLTSTMTPMDIDQQIGGSMRLGGAAAMLAPSVVLDLEYQGLLRQHRFKFAYARGPQAYRLRVVLLFIERWLKALSRWRMEASSQGNEVRSGWGHQPLLANLFLHYTFDLWMRRNHPDIPFERYADDVICHCRSEEQARNLNASLEQRFAECGLNTHPEKTKIVYCKDDDRRGTYRDHKFDFLGYTFRPRLSRRWHGFGVVFSPAASDKALKKIRQTVRGWALHERSDKSLDDLARMFNANIRGWINYYGRYYKSALYPTLRHIDRILARWAHRKFKSLRRHRRRSQQWLERIARRQPDLFAHWRLLQGRGRTMGAG